MKSVIIVFLLSLASVSQAVEKNCDGLQKAKVTGQLESVSILTYKVINKDGSIPENVYRLKNILSYEPNQECPLEKDVAVEGLFGLDKAGLDGTSVSGTIIYNLESNQAHFEK